MDNNEDIVKQFAKYCSQCDGQCCKRGVFTVFAKEAEILAKEYTEFQTCDVFDQRGTARDIYIGSQCKFNDGRGCILPMSLRPTDCLSFPFYPKLKEMKGVLEIDSFVIQNECPFSKEIANDKQFLEAMQKLWENTASNLNGQEIIDWIGANGSWQDWYNNAIEVKCNRRFNLKLKTNKQDYKKEKSISLQKIAGLMKYIVALILFFIPQPMSAQGLTNSSGYITCSGSPYITFSNASFDNSGTYTKASETILFSGTVASVLKGNASDYHNIMVSNTGGITLNTSNLATFDNLTINSGGIFAISPTGKLTVNTTLTNSAGTTGLVINSTTAGSGSLIHSTAGVSAHVQQFLTDAGATYYYHTVAPPISDATATVFKLLNSGPYLYYYNPSALAGHRWTNIVSSATALVTGTGYLINFKTQTTDETLNYSGTLNTGTYNLSLIAGGDGFNLVGNPYPCAIDWIASSGWTRTNVDNVIYTWVPANHNYGSYVTGVGGTLIDNIIPSGQGFFVHASGSNPVLGLTNAIKTHNNVRLKSAQIEPVKFKIRVTSSANGSADEAIVWYDPQATTKFDTHMEAKKFFSMSSDACQIYMQTEDSAYLSINALPTNYRDSIPLFFKCGIDTGYTLEVLENTGVDSIILTDLLTHKKENLLNTSYAYTALKTDTTRRFIINISEKTYTHPTGVGSENSNMLIYSYGKNIILKNLTSGQMVGNIMITNILGQTIVDERIYLETEVKRSVKEPGVYFVLFSDKGTVYKKKLLIQ